MKKIYLDDEFDKFWKKLENQENFTLLRYGDGERAIMCGEKVKAQEGWESPAYISKLGIDLNKSLNHKEKNFYYGISCPDCDFNAYQWYLTKIKSKNITFANLWVNGNYSRFYTKFCNLERDCILIANYKADKHNIGKLNVLKHYKIDDDCISFWEKEAQDLINNIKQDYGHQDNLLYVVAAGPISETIISELYKNNPNNCYIDFGSSIDIFIHNKQTRPYMDASTSYAHQNCWMYDPKYKNMILANNFMKTLFSCKNSENKTHKIIRLFGIKLKIRKGIIKHFIMDAITSMRFFLNTIKPKTVLIVEPNPYHGEILPGFVKYFKDLGFNVDLILRPENITDSPFTDIKDIKIFSSSAKNTKKLLNARKISQYHLLFFSTSALADKTVFVGSYLKYLNESIKNKYLLVEHSTSLISEYNEEKFVENGTLFSLSGTHNTKMLNPHYFKSIEPNHIKNNVVQFLIIGHVVKSRELLIEMLKQLSEYNIQNFKIIVIGSNDDELSRFPNIEVLGHLRFKDMYKEIEKADFILPMLNCYDEYQQIFLNGTTSGSKQLSLGFLKPLLINEKFADVYDFTSDNAIIYKDNNIVDAIKQAINMSQEEYFGMQVNLDELHKTVYSKSLNNLKKAIGK